MSSIPLVALGVNNPQAENPLQAQERIQQMRGQAQQQELVKRQIADQDAMTRALHDWDASKGDYGALSASVLRNGGSGNAAFQVMQHGLAVKKQVSDIAKQDAETGGKQLENLAARHDQALGAIKAAEDVPDDQLGAHVKSTVDGLVQSGMLKPEEAQPYAQLAQLPPDQMRAQLKLHEKQLQGEKAQIAQASSEAEQAKNTAQAGQATAETSKLSADTAKTQEETKLLQQYGGTSEAQQQMKYLNIQMNKRRGMKLSPEDQAFSSAYEHMKTLVPVANFNLQNGGTGTPGQPSAMAKAVADGTMKWQDVISPRTPMSVKNQFAQEVKAINPQFDTSTFTIEQKAAEKATSGQWADTRLAYNTAIDHSQQLLNTIDALNNGDTKKLNSLKNFFKTEFGSPDVPNYQAVANAYNHEVTAVVSKGHITDAEVAQGGSVLPSNASPQQLRGVVNQYKGLMTSKRDELDKIIKAGAGNKANGVINTQAGGDQSGSDPFAAFGGKARQ